MTRHSLNQERRRLKVLLGEDNPVNQKLASRLLEKWGHTVRVAATGAEAFEAFKQESFDLICMDVQMPEMNGYEATALIRGLEVVSGKHVPILAMTAHAMPGDKEKCMDAGMDDYISKPLDAAELFQLIEQLVQREEAEAAPLTTYDRAALIDRVEGDLDLVQELVDTFIESWAGSLAAIQAAVAAKDPRAIERAAHAVRSGVSLFGFPPLSAATEALETSARAGQLDSADSLLATIEQQSASLIRALQEDSTGKSLVGAR